MSDWKSRATPVKESSTSDWKSRAESMSQDSSDLKDLGIGLAQGGTLGFGDELLGAGQALKDVATGPTKLEDILKAYREHQKDNEAGVDAAMKRSPILVGGGQIAGGIVPGLLTGGIGSAATGSAKLAQLAAAGGAMGGIAGLGGSHGTVESNPIELAKDTGFGAGVGAVASPLISYGAGLGGNVLNKAKSGLSDFVDSNTTLKKLAYALGQIKQGKNFTSEQSGEDIQKGLQDAAKSISDQFMAPIKDSSSLYGQVLQAAADKGSKLSTSNAELMSALSAAKSRIGEKGGGLTDEMKSLLGKHGSSTFDPNTVSQVTNALDPREAKNLQLALRELAKKPAYQDTTAIDDAAKALNPAINSALPEQELNQINTLFGQARKAVAPIFNKSEVDPEFQSKDFSDIDPEQLGSKSKAYIQQLLGKLQDSNKQGDEARNAFNEILGNVSDVNASNKTQFLDPSKVKETAYGASMNNAIRKMAVGEKGVGSNSIGGLVNDTLIGSPIRAMQLGKSAIDKVGDIAEATKLPALGRNLYQATDDVLQGAAQRLSAAGHTDIANSLSSALQNKASAAKNATLFSIMQNPNYRKAVFGDDQIKEDKQ